MCTDKHTQTPSKQLEFLYLSSVLSSFLLLSRHHFILPPSALCLLCYVAQHTFESLSHSSLCLSLFSLYFTVCVGGSGGRRRILKECMSERKRWTFLSHCRTNTHAHTHLTCRHSHPHTNHYSHRLSGATRTSKWPQSISAAARVSVCVRASDATNVEA